MTRIDVRIAICGLLTDFDSQIVNTFRASNTCVETKINTGIGGLAGFQEFISKYFDRHPPRPAEFSQHDITHLHHEGRG